jgi:hypothetical protein
MQPETVVGTSAWFNKTGKHEQGRKWLSQYQEFCGHMSDSWNLHPTQPVRDAWILGTDQGCVHGNPTSLDPPLLGHQPKGYAKWVQGNGERWTPNKHNAPRVIGPREFNLTAQAGLMAMSQGKDAKAARKSAKDKLDATMRKTSSGTSSKSLNSTFNSTGGLGSTQASNLTLRGASPSNASLRDRGNNSQSLPSLALGPYPPSPAYVRSFMRQIDLEQPDR